MAIRDKWTFIEKKTARGKRTQAEIFADNIEQQIALADGKDVKTAKGNTIESWEVEAGVLRVKVGRRRLFEQDIDMGRRKLKAWLKDIKAANGKGEFDSEIAELQRKQDEEDKTRAASAKKNAKKK